MLLTRLWGGREAREWLAGGEQYAGHIPSSSCVRGETRGRVAAARFWGARAALFSFIEIFHRFRGFGVFRWFTGS